MQNQILRKREKNTHSAADVNVNKNTGTPKKKKNNWSAKVKCTLVAFFSK